MLAILLGTTLLGIVICISSITYGNNNKKRLKKSKKLIILLIITLLTILTIGNIIAQSIILTHVHTEEEKSQTINIVSYNYYGYTEERKINSGYGHSYIVTDEKEEYVYYYKVANGGYKQGSIPSKNTVIYEENDCKTPSITAYTTYTKSNYGLDIEKWTFLNFLTTTRYEIHIPKGTIIKGH